MCALCEKGSCRERAVCLRVSVFVSLRGRDARPAMALSKLSGDEQGIIFVQLCNVLDPRLVTTSCTNPGTSYIGVLN